MPSAKMQWQLPQIVAEGKRCRRRTAGSRRCVGRCTVRRSPRCRQHQKVRARIEDKLLRPHPPRSLDDQRIPTCPVIAVAVKFRGPGCRAETRFCECQLSLESNSSADLRASRKVLRQYGLVRSVTPPQGQKTRSLCSRMLSILIAYAPQFGHGTQICISRIEASLF